ncbi:Ger(x)C family spore germination protein [Paenibacillus oryzisoli]|uniref:Ger(x)C family spore germination protein n=1 Tax=Paenibacillus oryzisoli TaxID=1850517 RepID=UPI003D2A9CA7
MTALRKTVLGFLLPALLLLTTGCWNRHEADTVEYALAAGIDLNDKGQIVVTVLTPVLEAMKPSNNLKGEQKKTLSVSGPTTFEAIRNYVKITGRKLYWSHLQVLLIGEKAAKMNVRHYLDFFSLDPELRGTAYIAIVKGRALDLLESSPDIATISANYLRELIQHTDMEGNCAKVQFTEFARKFAQPTGGQPFSPIVHLIDQSDYVSQIVGIAPYQGKDTKQSTLFYANGTGVFRDERMVGTLSGKETRGFLWVMGELKSAIVAVPCPNETNCHISLELVDDLKTKRKVTYEGGKASIHLFISVEFNLGDKSGTSFKVDNATIAFLEKEFAKKIESEVHLAFHKIAVELHSDIFAFGNTVEDRNPKLWEQIKADWETSILPNAELTLEVEAKMRRTSRTLYSPWVKSRER